MKKIARKPKLFDAGGDLLKDWYVYFSFVNPFTGKLERHRRLNGLSKKKKEVVDKMSAEDIEQERQHRYEVSIRLIEQIETDLRNGYNPYRESPYIYSDEIKPLKRVAGAKTIEYYLREVEEHLTTGRRENTVKNYRIYLNNFLKWLTISQMDLLPISAIEHGHAERFLSSITVGGFKSNKWRNEHLSYLHRCFKQLMRLYPKLLLINPFELSEKVKHVRKKAALYRPEMRKRINKLLPKYDQQLWLFVQFIYYTGLRPGIELRSLQVNMIHLNESILVLPAHLAKDGELRVVTIPEQLELQLRAMKLDKVPGEYYLFSNAKKPGPEIAGKNYFMKAWRKFRETYNIPDDFKIYSWKHTGATAADDAGIDRRRIKDHLGHSTLQQTEDYLDSNKVKGSEEIRVKYPTL
jgi:integrase